MARRDMCVPGSSKPPAAISTSCALRARPRSRLTTALFELDACRAIVALRLLLRSHLGLVCVYLSLVGREVCMLARPRILHGSR